MSCPRPRAPIYWSPSREELIQIAVGPPGRSVDDVRSVLHAGELPGDVVRLIPEAEAERLRRELAATKGELAAVVAHRDGALALHQREPGWPWCATCLSDDRDEAEYTWPCPTARALGADVGDDGGTGAAASRGKGI